MRSRIRWIFAGLSALLLGYLVYRRSEAKRRADEQRRYLDREEKLREIAATMQHNGEAVPTPAPDDKPRSSPN